MLYVCKLFLCFIIFSIFGWCLEVGDAFVEVKKFVNRGFLIGPLCPVYGVGCLLIYILLNRYASDPIMLFIAAIVICSVLEYLTSYIMEKLFKARWWDYSHMKYNINGRICLETMIPFGILGLLVVYVLFPFALSSLSLLPDTAIYIIAGVMCLVFLVDFGISINVISKFPSVAMGTQKDTTEEINRFVKSTLSKKSKLTRRLVDSFPNFDVNLKAIKRKLLKKVKKSE